VTHHGRLPPTDGRGKPHNGPPRRVGWTEITIGVGIAALVALAFAAAVITGNPHVTSPYGKDCRKVAAG
jgi:hypothetical protein